MRRPTLLALAAALALATPAQAQAPAQPAVPQTFHYTQAEAEAVFRIANDACVAEDYAKCVEGYERLLSAGYQSVDLSYNLGTAYLRQGKLGPAILHLTRALRADPTDEDVRANLERARKLRVDKLVGAPEETSGEAPLSQRVVDRTRVQTFAALFLLLWAAGALLLVLRRFIPRAGLRGTALAMGAAAVLASLPCGLVLAAHVYVRDVAREAVVVAPAVPVREGPQAGVKATFEVHEGLTVRILDEEGGFRRIRLSNGLEGWVPAEDVAEINPG